MLKKVILFDSQFKNSSCPYPSTLEDLFENRAYRIYNFFSFFLFYSKLFHLRFYREENSGGGAG